jgi:hypothetical protein
VNTGSEKTTLLGYSVNRGNPPLSASCLLKQSVGARRRPLVVGTKPPFGLMLAFPFCSLLLWILTSALSVSPPLVTRPRHNAEFVWIMIFWGHDAELTRGMLWPRHDTKVVRVVIFWGHDAELTKIVVRSWHNAEFIWIVILRRQDACYVTVCFGVVSHYSSHGFVLHP